MELEETENSQQNIRHKAMLLRKLETIQLSKSMHSTLKKTFILYLSGTLLNNFKLYFPLDLIH